MKHFSLILIVMCYIHSYSSAQCTRLSDLVADYRSFVIINNNAAPATGSLAQMDSRDATADIYRSSLDTSFFTLSPQNVYLRDHLEALCHTITGNLNLSFVGDSVMIRLRGGTINISPSFIKWLLVISINNIRVESSSFNKLVADVEEMQRYCRNRAFTTADFTEYYTSVVRDFTRSLQHVWQVAQQLTPNCDAACLAQLKAQLSNDEVKVLQQLLLLAGEKHGGSGLGIFAKNDL